VGEDFSEGGFLCGGDEDGPEVDAFQCGAEVGVGAVGFRIEVPAQAAGEEVGLLGEAGDVGAEGLERDGGVWVAVYEDGAGGWVEEA
jgi:hypothetical protein